jgi:hypothetical protein
MAKVTNVVTEIAGAFSGGSLNTALGFYANPSQGLFPHPYSLNPAGSRFAPPIISPRPNCNFFQTSIPPTDIILANLILVATFLQEYKRAHIASVLIAFVFIGLAKTNSSFWGLGTSH